MEKYFEQDFLSDEDVVQGLRKAMLSGEIVLVLYSAPEKGYAVLPVLGALTRLMPSPNEVATPMATDLDDNVYEVTCSADEPLSAFVFKTRDDQYGKTSYIRVYSGQLTLIQGCMTSSPVLKYGNTQPARPGTNR